MRKSIFLIVLLLLTNITICYGNPDDEGLGKTIQIYTRFHSFVGKPSWLLMIRDVDHNQNIPYVFDIRRGDNVWVALTYGKNYLITASTMSFETYKSRYNKFKQYKIKNFCNLESNGRINRNTAMYIVIDGDLSPDGNGIQCHVSKYPEANFTVVDQD